MAMQQEALGYIAGTFHMLRVTLACKCVAARKQDSETQAILQWRSAEALRIYGRMLGARFADTLDDVCDRDPVGGDDKPRASFCSVLAEKVFDVRAGATALGHTMVGGSQPLTYYHIVQSTVKIL